MVRVAGLALLSLFIAAPALAMEVRLDNRTAPTECAEVDNVDFRVTAPSPVAFTIEATPPAYFDPDMTDHTAPVWDGCEGYDADDPVYTSIPAEFVLYEDAEWLLTGVRKPSFWRPAIVPVRVDDDQFSELHLLQLHAKRGDGEAVEVLVVYPPDGYWRAKPLAPAGHAERHGRDTAFGSSFLVGPIEEDGRPLVDLAEIAFVPAAARFELRFLRGGTGSVAVREVAVERLLLDIRLDHDAEMAEIAGLRSMFVTPEMADTAVVRWRRGDETGETAVTEPLDRHVDAARFVRSVPSEHNTSAPDLRFFDFRPLAATDG
jgi:hypothetical protein